MMLQRTIVTSTVKTHLRQYNTRLHSFPIQNKQQYNTRLHSFFPIQNKQQYNTQSHYFFTQNKHFTRSLTICSSNIDKFYRNVVNIITNSSFFTNKSSPLMMTFPFPTRSMHINRKLFSLSPSLVSSLPSPPPPPSSSSSQKLFFHCKNNKDQLLQYNCIRSFSSKKNDFSPIMPPNAKPNNKHAIDDPYKVPLRKKWWFPLVVYSIIAHLLYRGFMVGLYHAY